MWYTRILYGAAVAGALIFYTFYSAVFSWYVLLTVAFLPLLSLLLGLLSVRKIRCELSCAGRSQIGKTVSCTLHFFKGNEGKGLPFGHIFCRITAANLFSGTTETRNIHVLPGCDACEELSVICSHAGQVVFSLSRVRICDPAGLFRIPVRVAASCDLLVLPPICAPDDPPNLELLNPQNSRLVPKPGGGFAEEYEVRFYRSGDPVRAIHWKLSAKTEDPVIREALVPPERSVLVSLESHTDLDSVDSMLSRLLWLSDRLLSLQSPFLLLRDPPAEVHSKDDFSRALHTLLSRPWDPETKTPVAHQNAYILLVGPDSVKEVTRHGT